MQTIYNAANEIDAQMLVDRLSAEGIAAHIIGSHLAGAMGELPMGGFMRVQVADADVARASTIVTEWQGVMEKDVPDPESDSAANGSDSAPVSTRIPHGGGIWMLFAGAFIGALSTYALLRLPPNEDEVDFDKDGVIDETYHYDGVLLRSISTDRNGDGRADWRNLFSDGDDGGGTILHDDDFDGRDEARTDVRKGSYALTEFDLDGDGFYEVREVFVHGVLDERIHMAAPDGGVIKREEFVHGVLARSEADLDRDGTFETRWTFDALGEPRRAD
jgi:hypothetical protein